jgi:gamma-glutamylcyclotransferase (GGCT)/AIG2-like uncharacterized protein YtfP
MKKEGKTLVAVYGSLRNGLGNHRLLENSEYLGEFESKPEYSLYSLGGFPGLKENGTTSVVMEVYAVDEATARRVDQLEGYNPNSDNNTFYDKKMIETPYGEAGVYLYVNDIPEDRLVESGDWKQHRTNRVPMY